MTDEERSCGTCTACCEGWLVINTDKIKAYPGLACTDLKIGKGCGIYETRPNYPCRTFFCSWTDNSKTFPQWMKPELSKAIVMHDKLDWNNRKLDLVVPVGPVIPKKTFKWLMDFARTHKRPFVYAEHITTDEGKLTGKYDIQICGPEPMREKLFAWLAAGNTFW